jgi:hypothetical protein
MLRLVGASSDAGLPRVILLNHLQTGETVTLGRGNTVPAPNLVRLIADAAPFALSRRHAVIGRLLDGYSIEDAPSTNGTFVNAIRLTEKRTLCTGDIVSFCHSDLPLARPGKSPFLYIFDAEVAPAAAEPPFEPPVPAYVPRELRCPPAEETAPPALVLKIADLSLCAVCLEAMVAPHSNTGCSHSFCGECVTLWAGARTTCPVCRETLGVFTHNKVLDEILDVTLVPTLTAAEREAREARERSWHLLKHSNKKRKRTSPPFDIVLNAMRAIGAAAARGEVVPIRLVRYSRGAANGERATCATCTDRIALGDVEAVGASQDPRGVHHARCLAWPAPVRPVGSEWLRDEDVTFM